jgi:methionyl-tRNA formyltransferase
MKLPAPAGRAGDRVVVKRRYVATRSDKGGAFADSHPPLGAKGTLKKTLILTDNSQSCDLARELCSLYGDIEIYQSPNGPLQGISRLNVKKQWSGVLEKYDLLISIHCKQFFPSELVKGIRCINVHPGLNPYNRGWFPQVFSIINGLPSGITIHEIDEKLDHGPIIAQCEYAIQPWDTSGSAYAKIMELERKLVLEHFVSIREGTYRAVPPKDEGNINLKKDFDRLRKIDLEQRGTFREFINRLRALTHDDFRNAYFVEPSGKKVFVRIVLELEDSDVRNVPERVVPHGNPPRITVDSSVR